MVIAITGKAISQNVSSKDNEEEEKLDTMMECLEHTGARSQKIEQTVNRLEGKFDRVYGPGQSSPHQDDRASQINATDV